MFFSQSHVKNSTGSKGKIGSKKLDFFRKFGLKSRLYGHKNGPVRFESRPSVYKGNIFFLWPEKGLVFNPLSQKRFTRNRAQRGVTTTTSSQLLLRPQPRAH